MIGKAEIESIISLLDDPDEKIFDGIKDIVVNNFGFFSERLNGILHDGCNEIVKDRISTLAQMSISKIFQNDFLDYTSKVLPEPSLLDGVTLIEKTSDTSFDEHAFIQYMQELSRKVWLKLGDSTATESVRAIREVFENEHIHAAPLKRLYLNDIFSGNDKPMPKSMLMLVFLIVCQKNDINIRPILIPVNHEYLSVEVGYVNMSVARASNIPSKKGAIFAIDEKLEIKKKANILLGEPLPYYKYLKIWQLDRYNNIMANAKNYPGYYTVIMNKITEVIQKNIKY